jgi:hypothetical protein
VTNAKRLFVVSQTVALDELAPGPVPGPHLRLAFNACAVRVQSLHQMGPGPRSPLLSRIQLKARFRDRVVLIGIIRPLVCSFRELWSESLVTGDSRRRVS